MSEFHAAGKAQNLHRHHVRSEFLSRNKDEKLLCWPNQPDPFRTYLGGKKTDNHHHISRNGSSSIDMLQERGYSDKFAL